MQVVQDQMLSKDPLERVVHGLCTLQVGINRAADCLGT